MIFKNNTPVVITEKAIFNKQYKNPVYIVLMHSGSLMANIIKKVTNDTFSHSCIAFNSKLDPLYSFGTKGKGSSGIGFSVSDSKDKFFQTHNAYYHVYVMYVTDEALEKMKQKITYFEENRDKFKYDFSGLIDIYRGVTSEDHIYKMFCSRFVMSIINLATPLDKVPSLWKPNDITNLENISLINKGENFYEYDYKITETNERAIKNGTYAETSSLTNNTELNRFTYDGIIVEGSNDRYGSSLDSYTKIKLSDAVLRVYGTQIPSLEYIKINKDTLGYVWVDDIRLVALLNMEDKDDDNRWITTIRVTSTYDSDAFYNQLIKIAIQNKATNIRISKNNEKLQKLLKQNGFKQYDKTDSMLYYER